MEIITIQDLCDNLDQAVLDFGAEPRFKNNPAFRDVIGEIYTLISRMNIGDKMKDIPVKLSDNGVLFTYNSDYGDNYKFQLYCSNGQIVATSKTANNSLSDENYRPYQKAEAETITASILNDDGIEITKQFGVADTIGSKSGEYNILPSIQRDTYNSEGVMMTSEGKGYKETEHHGDIANIENEFGVYTNYAFDASDKIRPEASYVMRRDSYDTCFLYSEKTNKETGYIETDFKGIIPINTQYNFRRLSSGYGFNDTDSVIINTKNEQEIKEELQLEPNPRTRESLMQMSAKRCKGKMGIYYNSDDDLEFITSAQKSAGIAK